MKSGASVDTERWRSSRSPCCGLAGAPLAHPVAVHGVVVELEVTDDGVSIRATVRTADRTGVEMEALTCVSVAALTVVDMVKAVDRHTEITGIAVVAKSGGRSGDWRRD